LPLNILLSSQFRSCLDSKGTNIEEKLAESKTVQKLDVRLMLQC